MYVVLFNDLLSSSALRLLISGFHLVNNRINKVIGIGMSKTGTSTLGICLEFLGFGPHKGFDSNLTEQVKRGDIANAIEVAKPAGFLEDSPWFFLYEELDRVYPDSKFILTLRKSSDAHAHSNWQHTLRYGQRELSEKEERIAITRKRYESHNSAVRSYFADRPEDLLEICWEKNEGWEKLCPFLGVDIPLVPIPHANAKPSKVAVPLAKLLKRKKVYVARMKIEQVARKLSTAKPKN